MAVRETVNGEYNELTGDADQDLANWSAMVTRQRGGARAGAGRKPSGNVKHDVSLPADMWAWVDALQAERGYKSRSETVELLLMLAQGVDMPR